MVKFTDGFLHGIAKNIQYWLRKHERGLTTAFKVFVIAVLLGLIFYTLSSIRNQTRATNENTKALEDVVIAIDKKTTDIQKQIRCLVVFSTLPNEDKHLRIVDDIKCVIRDVNTNQTQSLPTAPLFEPPPSQNQNNTGASQSEQPGSPPGNGGGGNPPEQPQEPETPEPPQSIVPFVEEPILGCVIGRVCL